MKKAIFSIPIPCHEDWDNMTSTDKGRFCLSCKKDVVDFAAMTDNEIIRYFNKASNEVCGSFLPEQLDRTMAVAKEPFFSWKYFFHVFIPVFLFSQRASSQELRKSITSSIKKVQVDTTEAKKITSSELLSAKVKKEDDPFPVRSLDTVVVKASYRTRTLGAMMGVSYVIQRRTVTKFVDTLLRRNIITVYPNPVVNNSAVNIDMRSVQTGEYSLLIADVSGKILQQENIQVPGSNFVFHLDLKATITNGTYFMRIINPAKKLSYTEKIMIMK
ncbi:T9SS type A sorting domain-containing protein [Ferruginibacter albus]|uniref:T9SS type A sorting domain-containing protein n=1 Tax=Ferruginibacter albus TaxID=2875540 RepID=UPI001CC4ED0E|nr:T9SS type A sorting domain-containing protein [Ferruginibacter albus]UAY53024.1 T9SS type A sorting domain-containing protein [Ferruginibacter albus]